MNKLFVLSLLLTISLIGAFNTTNITQTQLQKKANDAARHLTKLWTCSYSLNQTANILQLEQSYWCAAYNKDTDAFNQTTAPTMTCSWEEQTLGIFNALKFFLYEDARACGTKSYGWFAEPDFIISMDSFKTSTCKAAVLLLHNHLDVLNQQNITNFTVYNKDFHSLFQDYETIYKSCIYTDNEADLEAWDDAKDQVDTLEQNFYDIMVKALTKGTGLYDDSDEEDQNDTLGFIDDDFQSSWSEFENDAKKVKDTMDKIKKAKDIVQKGYKAAKKYLSGDEDDDDAAADDGDDLGDAIDSAGDAIDTASDVADGVSAGADAIGAAAGGDVAGGLLDLLPLLLM